MNKWCLGTFNRIYASFLFSFEGSWMIERIWGWFLIIRCFSKRVSSYFHILLFLCLKICFWLCLFIILILANPRKSFILPLCLYPFIVRFRTRLILSSFVEVLELYFIRGFCWRFLLLLICWCLKVAVNIFICRFLLTIWLTTFSSLVWNNILLFLKIATGSLFIWKIRCFVFLLLNLTCINFLHGGSAIWST